MQAQVSRPTLPPQEAVVPAAVANRGFGRRDPANEQCKYCTMIGHFVRACPRLNHDIERQRCSRSLKGEILGPRGERVNWNSPGGMRRAVLLLNNLEIAAVEAEPIAEIVWDLPRGRGPQANFILEGNKQDRVNITTRRAGAEKKLIRDTVMEEAAGASVDQEEAEAGEQEKDFATITRCTVNKEVAGSIRGAGGEIPFTGYVTKCAVRAGIRESIWSFQRMTVMEEMDHDIILGRPWCANVEMIGMHLHDGTYMVDIEDPVTGREELLRLLGTGGDPPKGKLATWSPTFEESARKGAFARMQGMRERVEIMIEEVFSKKEWIKMGLPLKKRRQEDEGLEVMVAEKESEVELGASLPKPKEGRNETSEVVLEIPNLLQLVKAIRWFVFRKPDKTLRWIQDLQKLNAVTIRDTGSLPQTDLLAESHAGRSIYSLVDLYSGYDQLPLDARDRPYTAMHTPVGQLQMQVTPMDFTNVVAEAQRRMLVVTGDMFPEKCEPYIDDNLVKGARHKDETEVEPGMGFIWQFDYKVERIAGLRNRPDGLSRVCITPEGVADAEPIDAFLEYEGGTLAVDNEMADPAITTGQLLIQILEKGAPAVVAELREGPVTTVRRKEEKDSWGAEVGAREELMAMIVEGGQDAMMTLAKTWAPKECQYLVNQTREEQDTERKEQEFFLIQMYEGVFREISLLLVRNKQPSEVSSKAREEAEMYVLRNGHLFKKEEGMTPRRVVCGRSTQLDVIQAMRDGLAGGHRSSKGTLAKIVPLYFWPGMAGMVATYCQTCLICQERSSVRAYEPLTPTRVLGPGHLVRLDLAVMPVSTDGFRYILDARDNLSGYVEAVALKRKTGKPVADWVEDFYLRPPLRAQVYSR
ncbi:hypothetical protein CBR_g41025 [Chara braunii]|uniref:Uncharacterized protein n=1 Tax=Chara braunii TaxID=69332 RepID=A0A388LV88_CHABU|nr:hypothetical protein CBR_g41025 [Chara braunii]|eukprot:GBG86122.1 hypothetical protein CBR_g41025 [Chara braunii]